MITLCRSALLLLCLLAAAPAFTQDAPAEGAIPLLDPADATLDARLTPSSGQVTFERNAQGLDVQIAAGDEGYPGLRLTPPDGKWDLSSTGHVEARVRNTSERALHLSLRVDNDGDWKKNPWNTESISVKPGEVGTVRVIYGHSYGKKPGYKLDPAKVSGLLLFTGKRKEPVSFRVESLQAAGPAGETPPVNPDSIRVTPKGGVVVGDGVDAAKELAVRAQGGTAEVVDGQVRIAFDAKAEQRRAAIRPAVGRWNLRDYLEVRVTLTNTGDTPVTPTVWLESGKGDSDKIAAAAPIAPGASATVTVPFQSKTPWRGPEDATKKGATGTGGSPLASNVVAAVALAVEPSSGPAALRVDSVTAAMPAAVDLPDWLGRRPPVEGDWTLTFEDNFDSPIDPARWNIYTANFWDKRSHFSKDNVIVEDGVVKLRFERKTGHHNDDPEGKVTDYATGFLDTYGKWTQRYGYFEARMKLPEAPGMWPAFWLMPDRGVEAGPQWKRADIGRGGMEFDIMEYLSRWGPNRFSPAFHWDGYNENHKSTGSTVYFAPDKDGFVTAGLLWLPGVAVLYCNGVEYARWENDRISSVQSYPIFTAVSGGWDNDPIDDAQLPSDSVIDYIRVWQRSDLAEKPAE